MALEVYGTESCSNCTLLLSYLKNKNIEHNYHLLVTEEEKDILRQKGIRRVPAIFDKDGKYLGSYNEFMLAERNK